MPSIIDQKKNMKSHLGEIGFGTLGFETSTESKQILKQALLNGVGMIDTSPCFGDGAVEISVGEVINELIYNEQITRDSITIISKAGVFEGKQLQQYDESFPNMVRISDKTVYCIHPDALQKQIKNSLARLNVDYLDVLLIESPDVLLKNVESEKLYDMLVTAFTYLEKEILEGRLKAFGVSSSVFSVDQRSDNLSLKKLLSLKEECSFSHFQYIQAPFNLLEPTIALKEGEVSVLDLAYQSSIKVLTTRPLNAIHKDQMFRLVDVEDKGDISSFEIQDMMDQAIQIEHALKEAFSKTELPEELGNYLGFYSQLSSLAIDDVGLYSFLNLANHSLYPAVEQYLGLIGSVLLSKELEASLYDYFSLLKEIISAMITYLTLKHNQDCLHIKAVLSDCHDHYLPELQLRYLACKAYLNTKGIVCVFLGIHSKEHMSFVDHLATQDQAPMSIDWDRFHRQCVESYALS